MKDPVLVVEAAPGERGACPAGALDPSQVKAPPFAICRMTRLGNGDYRPVPVEWGEWISLRDDAAARLGINLSRNTLIRLWLNGYIKMRQPSPQIYELNLASLVDHLRAVRDDSGFWSRPAADGTNRTRREAYAKEIY